MQVRFGGMYMKMLNVRGQSEHFHWTRACSVVCEIMPVLLEIAAELLPFGVWVNSMGMVLALSKCKCPVGSTRSPGSLMSLLHVWITEESNKFSSERCYCETDLVLVGPQPHRTLFFFSLSLFNIALNIDLSCVESCGVERLLTCPWGPARQVSSLSSTHCLAAVIGPEIKGERCLWSPWPGVVQKLARAFVSCTVGLRQFMMESPSPLACWNRNPRRSLLSVYEALIFQGLWHKC